MSQPDTALSAVKAAEARLVAMGIDTARLDAEILMAHVLGCRRMTLYSRSDLGLSPPQRDEFEQLVVRRLLKEPVAYLTGDQEFWSLTFKVTPDTLIPRPDTETLVEAVLSRQPTSASGRLLDLGTGTGCILLSLLHELPAMTGVGADISDGALRVATANAQHLKLADRAALVFSNWFENIEGLFEIIVSNPPYIPSADIGGLMADVRDYEPMSALVGGEDGLDPYRLIASEAPKYLSAGGLLAVEVGIGQAKAVSDLFRSNGFSEVGIQADLGGIDRVVIGKKSGEQGI